MQTNKPGCLRCFAFALTVLMVYKKICIESYYNAFDNPSKRKLSKFNKNLVKWDKENETYDKVTDLKEEVDPDIITLFGLWKHQRKLTLDAIEISGENDAILRKRLFQILSEKHHWYIAILFPDIS